MSKKGVYSWDALFSYFPGINNLRNWYHYIYIYIYILYIYVYIIYIYIYIHIYIYIKFGNKEIIKQI